MPDLSFVIADVFTDAAFGGNQLAVFPHADGIAPGQMQAIARELNLSETVFVLPPTQPGATHRLRIFTPAMELPFAGHPTVGAAIVLAELGMAGIAVTFEEGVGLVPVDIERRAGVPLKATLTSPKLPERIEMPLCAADLAPVLGIPTAAIGPAEPRAYSAGVPFTFVPVADAATLAQVRLDTGAWASVLSGTAAPHLYLFSMPDWQHGREVRARMFAPAMGIAEDPATGGAAAAFAGFLADLQHPADGVAGWVIHQGYEMGRSSQIALDGVIEGGRLSAVRVGGSAVLVAKGALLPQILS